MILDERRVEIPEMTMISRGTENKAGVRNNSVTVDRNQTSIRIIDIYICYVCYSFLT